jgi:hypothetical protein
MEMQPSAPTNVWRMVNGREHYIAIFLLGSTTGAMPSTASFLVVYRTFRMKNSESTLKIFGFSADDTYSIRTARTSTHRVPLWGQRLCNRALCNKLQGWLLANKCITRVIPLVGCACHRHNLAVKHLYKVGRNQSDLR